MTPTVPALFKEIHRLRRHLKDLQSEIDLGPRVAKIQQQRLAAEEQAHKDAHDALKKAKLKQKDDEGTLKSTEARLLKLQADINTAGSKKEFDAKTSEITQATAKRGELEDAILETLTDIETRTADLPAVDKKWADAQAEHKQNQADAAERLQRLLHDQTESKTKLTETEGKIPAEVKGQYDRLIKSYGPDGLAAVVGKTCQQCRSETTEQQRVALKGGAFVCCSRCGRGLYLSEG